MPVSPHTTLRAFVAGHDSQRAAAEALGISQAYLSDLLHKRRDCSPAIVEKLGLESITTFRKKRSA